MTRKMLQFKGFPSILNFAVYFLKKTVKVRECAWTIHPQQEELTMHIQQKRKLDCFQAFTGMDLMFSIYRNMQISP